jgi:hypothetical protein
MFNTKFDHSPVLSRRSFIKLVYWTGIIALQAAILKRTKAASVRMNFFGYGSGKYGIGMYGSTSAGYSIFLPITRK